jgi:hypothetical protein
MIYQINASGAIVASKLVVATSIGLNHQQILMHRNLYAIHSIYYRCLGTGVEAGHDSHSGPADLVVR